MKLLATVEGRERTVEFSGELSAARQTFSVDGEPLDAEILRVERGIYSVLMEGRSYEILIREGLSGLLDVYVGGHHFAVRTTDPRRARRRQGALQVEGRQSVTAPMPGKVIRVLVGQEQQVDAGQGLIVIEAMKMQNEIRSPKAGRVVEVKVAIGEAVNSGQVLLVVE